MSKGSKNPGTYDSVVKKVDHCIWNVTNNEEVNALYHDWAEIYDQEMAITQRKSPEYTVGLLMKYINSEKQPRILDLAAGTGIVGEKLIEAGFTNIDALDGNESMLKVAEKKHVYNKIMCEWLLPDKHVGIENDTYDAVVCVGSFYDGHLGPQNLPEIRRIVKKGGYVLITRQTRGTELDEVAYDQQSKGWWKVNSEQHVDSYKPFSVLILEKL